MHEGALGGADWAIPVSSGVSSGTGGLEVFRLTNGRAFRLDAHVARMTRTLSLWGFGSAAGGRGELGAEAGEREIATLLHRDLPAVPPGDWRVRWVVVPDGSGLTSFLQGTPFQPSSPIRAILRAGRVTAMPGHKTLSYAAGRAFLHQARMAGADECLLHEAGELLEGASSNLFIVREGILCTPPPQRILPGITRDWVMETASMLGFLVEEAELPISVFDGATEAFITSAARGPVALSQVEDRGFGAPGPIFRAIRTAYAHCLEAREVPCLPGGEAAAK